MKHTPVHHQLLMSLILIATSSGACAASCMVLGEKSARIKAAEGERSPVFVTADCEALRLVSGKGFASWVGRDGKPRMIPITKDGIEFAPVAGAEERSVTVVWNELTTKRERQQPAYMRNIGEERPPKLYVPKEGIVLLDSADANADLIVENSGGTPVFSKHVTIGESVAIPRDALLNSQIYKISLKRIESEQQWRWRIVTPEEMQTVDQGLAQIDAGLSDPEQARIMRAMLFEQLKIQVNMNLTLQGMR